MDRPTWLRVPEPPSLPARIDELRTVEVSPAFKEDLTRLKGWVPAIRLVLIGAVFAATFMLPGPSTNSLVLALGRLALIALAGLEVTAAVTAQANTATAGVGPKVAVGKVDSESPEE